MLSGLLFEQRSTQLENKPMLSQRNRLCFGMRLFPLTSQEVNSCVPEIKLRMESSTFIFQDPLILFSYLDCETPITAKNPCSIVHSSCAFSHEELHLLDPRNCVVITQSPYPAPI